jgi:hypothetical protein
LTAIFTHIPGERVFHSEQQKAECRKLRQDIRLRRTGS